MVIFRVYVNLLEGNLMIFLGQLSPRATYNKYQQVQFAAKTTLW